MASKKELLKNITNYTPEEIADAVRSGIVSMYELGKDTEGAFTPLLRKRVKELLEQAPMPTVENDKEDVSEIEKSAVSDSSTTEDISIPDELEIAPIAEELPSLIKEDTQTTQDSIENKPSMFRNPFSFSGRIRRTEYGLSMIICFVINLFMQGIVGIAAESDAASALLILYLIMLIPYFWFIWAQGAKRCHDRGNSGWYQIIPFYSLWMLFAEGETGTNEYGNSPK